MVFLLLFLFYFWHYFHLSKSILAANADAIAESGNVRLLLANLSADTRQEFQSKALNLLLNLTGGSK